MVGAELIIKILCATHIRSYTSKCKTALEQSVQGMRVLCCIVMFMFGESIQQEQNKQAEDANLIRTKNMQWINQT